MKLSVVTGSSDFRIQPPSGGCVLKLTASPFIFLSFIQPPSGGCVLKQYHSKNDVLNRVQPPSGGCVLKQSDNINHADCVFQPPSGGCVLKLVENEAFGLTAAPAAFRRLCVETHYLNRFLAIQGNQPPSGGCVLKRAMVRARALLKAQPPSGGCVLKPFRFVAVKAKSNQPPSGGCVLKQSLHHQPHYGSFPAAFRRLCVETNRYQTCALSQRASRLQAAVC